MKKTIAFVLGCVCALSIVGCAVQEEEVKYDLIPMVMVAGKLYLDTGHTYYSDDVTYDDEITSAVDGSERPTEDNQSNFGTGYGYRYGATEGTIEILMNNKWCIYATEEAKQRMLSSENNDASEKIDVVKEPPTLTVIYGANNRIEALKGSSSLFYLEKDGTSLSVCADSAHPLQSKEDMPSIKLLPPYTSDPNPSVADLRWDTAPDEVSVRCWSENDWENPDAESEEIQVRQLRIDSNIEMAPVIFVELKDGNYIYEVIAEWNSSEECSGTARYSFYTVK